MQSPAALLSATAAGIGTSVKYELQVDRAIARTTSTAFMDNMDITISSALLRLPQVMRTTGLARSTVYKLLAARSFPVPVRITGRSVAWHAMEVQSWIGERSRAK